MSDQVTVKVVQQVHNLQYHGHRQKSLTDGSVQAVAKLLGVASATASEQGAKTLSSVIYQGTVSESVDKIVGAVGIGYEPALGLFQSFDEPEARRAMKDFFASVEAGKKALFDKYGSLIPATEVDRLSAQLSSKSCVIWYCQIMTVRLSDQQFPGSRKRRVDGQWSSTVKSMTVYRSSSIPEEQIDRLRQIMTGLEKYEDSQNVGRLKKTNTMKYAAFLSPSGKVILQTNVKDDPMAKADA